MAGKNIIICFDGTCNHPKSAKQEREWFGLGDIDDKGITNVLKLHLLLGGTLDNRPHNKQQHSLYYSGVGTYGNKVQQLFNAAFAPNNLDVARIIKQAGYDLQKIYKKNDRIFLFGFSRGAALARRFAAVIDKYVPVKPEDKVVRFIGVFDTVAAIGFPNLDDDDKPVSDVIFENCTVSGHVQEALHLVSLDDKRIAFLPTLMNKEDRVTEVWFAGAHSDVGGGFWFDGLSDISLDFMLKELEKRELGLTVLSADDVQFNKLGVPAEKYQLDYDDLFIKPRLHGKIHTQDRWLPIARATLTEREVRVNINDKPAPNELPLVHYTAIERIKEIVDYRPKALKGVKHNCLHANGNTIEHRGIRDHIDV
ncbi:Uncharacterized alpha/beta hydrolase domain [Malonomonas rubra DSM 5091]|uniref:Uncharacterized alpha/beta hydrolase domain n=1 Tax=Malonomonas rubra DSM 5091 TaxID=1122189 RepID=A0A1M6I8G2_MALRU|nr:DUF2235 domain-containing protein [Malonomonas rubra]SHJ30663.1 Uncharacterized alpha/beta hydrolase domain [Malonomonas rubra DSM 5091]